MKRILITGGSGFLGGHLCERAQSTWEVYGSFHRNAVVPKGTNGLCLNLEDLPSFEHTLDKIDPAAVILTAVFQVDACEKQPENARRVNVQASRLAAGWCRKHGRRLIYISSDLVFDGKRGMYREPDTPAPVMLYGRLKLEGEQEVLAANPAACVVRLPLMYGKPVAGGSSFFTNMLDRLSRGERVRVFHDQYRTPGLVENMATALLELAVLDYSGRIHLAGETRCSRAGMAEAVCRRAGFDESLLETVSMFDVELAAPRPQDVSLDSSLARDLLKTELIGIEEGVRQMLTPPEDSRNFS